MTQRCAIREYTSCRSMPRLTSRNPSANSKDGVFVNKRRWHIAVQSTGPIASVLVAALLTLSAVTANAQVSGPTLGDLFPNSSPLNGPAFTLAVTGSGFTTEDVVQWEINCPPVSAACFPSWASLTTNFVSSSMLTAAVPAGLVADSSRFFTPLQCGATGPCAFVRIARNTNLGPSVPFAIGGPAPRITSLAPSAVVAGG